MNKKVRVIIGAILAVVITILLVMYIKNTDIAVLNPQGTIAAQQKDLMIFATVLMLLIVVPVFILTFAIAWRYREGNKKAMYSPQLSGNTLLESIWWGFPLLIIAMLSVVIVKSSHELDPFKPLASSTTPLEIQVVALQWKWLFIYPEQNIATINYLKVPEDTPLNFRITGDAPMNSFWIPQLGGQVYAMAGMETKLHLMASKQGIYAGSSANLSGEGFAGMKFTVDATSSQGFDAWVQSAKNTDQDLSLAEYEKLAEPSKNVAKKQYGSYQSDLYDTIMKKYMSHTIIQDDNHSPTTAQEEITHGH